MEKVQAFIGGFALAVIITAGTMLHFLQPPTTKPVVDETADPVYLAINHDDGFTSKIFCNDITALNGQISKRNLTKLSQCAHEKMVIQQVLREQKTDQLRLQ